MPAREPKTWHETFLAAHALANRPTADKLDELVDSYVRRHDTARWNACRRMFETNGRGT